MVASALMQTRDRTWSPVLDGLAAPALDCIQTGLAALLDRAHGSGTHLVLGAPLGFAPRTAPGRPPTVEVPVSQRLTEAREFGGLRVVEHRDGLDGPALRRFADEAGTLYVVADTFTMPWTPYRGQRHMEHSLLLVPSGGEYTVVDPYHNDTQWGAARPGVWRLSPHDFDPTVAGGASAMVMAADPLPTVDPGTVLAGNARALVAARPDIERYLAEVSGDLDGLVLDVWLLGRSRLLHADWLGTVAGVPLPLRAVAQEQAQEWLRLAAQSYLGLRRTQRGAALPPSIVERMGQLLAADVGLAVQLAASTIVLDAIRAVLRLEDADVPPSLALRTLPNFNSFRLVDIVERVESRLDVMLEAEDLTVEALHDVDSLVGLFTKAVGRAHE